jgi:DNA repair protein RecO (recombination protein O)
MALTGHAFLRFSLPPPADSGFVSGAQNVRGYIVGRVPFGNTSLILRVITEGAGRITLMAKGATRPKSPLSGQLDLFYLADFQYQPARQSEIHTLREAKVLEPHLGLRRSYANLLAVQYFAALVETMTESATPIPQEFELFGKALRFLCETDVSRRVVERFEQRMVTLAGLPSEYNLPRALSALHQRVPALRDDLIKLFHEE